MDRPRSKNIAARVHPAHRPLSSQRSLGPGVSLPSGAVNSNGMTFSGTLSDGSTFSGRLNNNIGAGYSPLDGFGFINAQTAVSQTVQ